MFTVVGFVAGYWRRVSEAEAARWLDEREGLQQRLATALEVSKQDRDSAWKTLVVSDALLPRRRSSRRGFFRWDFPGWRAPWCWCWR